MTPDNVVVITAIAAAQILGKVRSRHVKPKIQQNTDERTEPEVARAVLPMS